MAIIELRTHPIYWHAIESGYKTFEVREYKENNRDFKIGDSLRIINKETGQALWRTVGYILKDTDLHASDLLHPGVCIVGFM